MDRFDKPVTHLSPDKQESFEKRLSNNKQLPELPIQHADFAVWQDEWLQEEALSSQLSYWKQQLSGNLPVLKLPVYRSRPTVQTFQGARQSLELPQNLADALKTLSQRTGTTLFTILLAAFQTLLYRYSGQEDVIVGSPIAGSKQLQKEGQSGYFINTVALRTHFSNNLSFRELLNRVYEVVLEAYTHHDLPLNQLVEKLQPQKSLSHTPLFQAMFVFQDAAMSALDLSDLTLSALQGGSGTTKFDLTLFMEDTGERLLGTLEYNADLLEASTISLMFGHLQTLLEAVVAHPEQQINNLSLLTEAERHQQLLEWNVQAEYSQDVCIHELFEIQVERSYDRTAVVFEDERLTYGELNQKANQLAHYLQSLGVGPDVLVGICVERSLYMIIGLLGILKAGGGYVPLDPDYPQERLAFMLKDCQPTVLLTQQQLIKRLPRHEAQVICLDTDWERIGQKHEENLNCDVKTENLAYVIYTSGSTGQPKGVMVSHANVVRLFAATQSWYHFNEQDVWTLFHSYAFDFSVWEIWGALLYGGRLVIVPYWVSRSPEDFYHLLSSERVTVLNQTPSAFRQLMRAEESLGISNDLALRLVIFGGEALDIQSLKPWFEHHSDQSPQLVNMYGITEATVHVTYRPLTKADLEVISGSFIGRPIPDLQVYLLDTNSQLVPIGVLAEMYIGGAGLAKGYLNRAELTKEKFIPNPFSNKPDARLYRSGDLARYLPNGDIEYLGRIDHQVKIRGFRIELGEIEAVLSKHPDVIEVVVIDREDHLDDKRLVAYVVLKQKQTVITSELRHFLKENLPEYMVPSTLMILEKLPLTSNGKVDRRALPAPETSSVILEGFVPPRNTIEMQLARIWSNILDIYPVGVKDDFFDIGGHSLLAVRLVGEIQQKLGKSLPLATLLQNATIEHMAALLQQKTDFQPKSSLVAIQPEGNRAPFFCVHPVGGNIFSYLDLARNLGFEQPFYGLQSVGLNGEQEPLIRIEDMASCYIGALQGVQSQGPYYLGGWSLGGVIAFEMAQQLRSSGHEVALLALIDSYAPIALKKSEDIDEAMLVVSLAKDLGRLFGRSLPLSIDKLKQLNSDEQLHYILEQVKKIDILPIEAGLQQIKWLLQVFRSNHRAFYSYTPQRYPGLINFFCASEQAFEVTEALSQRWESLTTGGIKIHTIPGDHYTIVREPYVKVLAEQIEVCLKQVRDTSPVPTIVAL